MVLLSGMCNDAEANIALENFGAFLFPSDRGGVEQNCRGNTACMDQVPSVAGVEGWNWIIFLEFFRV